MRKYENVSIDKLKPYERNARTHSDAQVEKIAKSIKEFGFINPVLIDGNFGIIAGHGRVLGAKKLGMTEVPCLFVEDLTKAQKKAYILADNKLALDAGWDDEILKVELNELKDMNFDLSLTGFDDIEINGLEEPQEIVEDEVPEADEEKEPICKLGDIWQLGEHRLMCGDSTDAGTVAILMNGKKADLLLTDPPYNVAYEGKTKDALTIENDRMRGEEFREFLVSAFTAAVSVLKDGGGFYVWFASREHCNFETALNESGLEVRQELIWKKNTMVLGRQDYQWKHEPCLYGWKDGASHNWYSDRCQTTILEFNKPARNGEHPTMKPVELFAYQIQNSTKKMDIVLDLFGGSGTTIIACEQTGRIGYSMELDPKYCDVIIKRYENLTGNKAVKIN